MVLTRHVIGMCVADTNTPWLAKLLYSRGVDLVRVEFIPDSSEEIQKSVLALKERVGKNGVVFTSGGQSWVSSCLDLCRGNALGLGCRAA